MSNSQPEVVKIDDEEFYQWRVVLRIPKNWTPESGVFIAVAPPGGIANFPAAVQGDNGFSPAFRNIDLVELEPDDETEASARWTLVTAATTEAGPVYDLEITLHRGAVGDAGTLTILDATDFDDTGASAGYVLALKSDGGGGYDAVEAVARKVGNMYWPTSVTVLSNASGDNAHSSVSIPTQPWPYRVCVEGQCTLSPDGPDVQADLVARLGATDGDVIARGQGLASGADQNLVFSPAPPVNSAAGFGEVTDGAAKVVYIRIEQQGAGSDTFDTVSGRAFYSVRVEPLP